MVAALEVTWPSASTVDVRASFTGEQSDTSLHSKSDYPPFRDCVKRALKTAAVCPWCHIKGTAERPPLTWSPGALPPSPPSPGSSTTEELDLDPPRS